jgi:lycopene cyclase domain-containing protein
MLSYWVWLAILVFVPMLGMLAWKGKELLKCKKTIILCGIGSLIFAVPWDHFAIKNGLWSFPTNEITGIWFLGLPLEEWCFIFFIGMELGMAALICMAFAGEKDA